MYERTGEITEKVKRKKLLRAVKLDGDENNALYYTCNPEQIKNICTLVFN